MASTIETGVLVIGGGPSGLFTALLLAKCGVEDISVIDKRPTPVQTGHAAGLQPRTLEILHSLKLYNDFAVNSGAFADTAFWSSSGDTKGLSRASVAPEVVNETIYRRILCQHQGRTEAILNSELEQRGIRVHRPFEFLDYDYTDNKDYPVCAYIMDTARGMVDQWHCKYLIAADGARSAVREAAGVESSVNETGVSWMVADVLLDTDFPDVRRRCPIRTTQGNLMLIPMPENAVRIYTLLSKDDEKELESSTFENPKQMTRNSNNRTTLLDILKKRLPSIIKPYTMNVKSVRWISRYTIAQKVINDFTDGKRILFVGDSCHSHSPKAAQGMNTAIQDAFNLSWKLALVLRGRADPKLLQTYDTERKHIAHQLIEFDTKFAQLSGDQSKISSPDFTRLWRDSCGFTSGLQHHYPPNPLVADTAGASIDEGAVEPLTPGKRLLPMRLIRHIDGFETTSLDTMPANGEFSELVFAGDIAQEPRKSEFKKLLASSSSVLTVYNGTPTDGKDSWLWQHLDIGKSDHPPNSDKMMSLHVVHTANHLDFDLQPDFSLWRYNFCQDTDGVEHRRHGVDPNGPMQVAIIRPDGVVGLVRPGDENLGKEVRKYFEQSFLREMKS